MCAYFLGLCTQLLPVLASALEFGSAAAPALTVLLKMGSWLPADQFSAKVIIFLWHSSVSAMINTHLIIWLFENAGAHPFQVLPTIVKLFASNDRAIRVSLLQHIDQFGESLTAQTVDEQVCDFSLLDNFLSAVGIVHILSCAIDRKC
jgi:SCY1-like protein 1